MPTILKFDTEARADILKGVETLADAVGSTMGARGRQVLIEQGYTYPRFTCDGVSVAKAITLDDKFQNLGAQALRQIAVKQVETCGDGTTASIVLAAEIYREGAKAVAAGLSAVEVKRGIDEAVSAVVQELRAMAIPVGSEAKGRKRKSASASTAPDDKLATIRQIATISAHGDTSVGDIIARAAEAVGHDGVVSIEHSKLTTGMELEVVDGCRIEAGYTSPFFATQENMDCVLEAPYILLTDLKIETLPAISTIINGVLQANRSLLIISDEIVPEVMQTIIVNKLQGALRVACVKLPAHDTARTKMLGDIAALTGGKVISGETGSMLEGTTVASLGQATRVVVTKDKTDIIGGKGSKNAIEKRAREVRNLLKKSTEEPDKKHNRDRLARLTAGVAVIRVGGQTELEAKELIDRVDDALHAVRAAREEGIVPGGGAALLRAADTVAPSMRCGGLDADTGARILLEACRAPLKRIVQNAGGNGDVVAFDVLRRISYHPSGKYVLNTYNATNGEGVNALAAGIIDPAKVVRCALQNAASVAGLLITTDCLIVEKPKEEKEGGM